MPIKLNGKPLSLMKHGPLDDLLDFLNSLPDDEVLSAAEILKRGIAKRNSLFEWARTNPRLSFYCFLVPVGSGACRGTYVFGNPRAIIVARKQITKQLEGK